MSDAAIRVAVDARALREPPCGLRRYLENLLGALLRVDHLVEYILYTDGELTDYPGKDNERVELRIVSGSHKALFRPWWELVSLPRALRGQSIDLFFSPFATVPGWCPVTSVVTIHDLAFIRFPSIQPWNYRLYWKWAVGRSLLADAVIAVSHSTKADIEELLGIPSEKIEVVWEAADEKFLHPASREEIDAVRTQYGLKGDFVLFVGAREPRKNLKTLAEAMTQVNKERDKMIPLVLVGSSEWGGQEDVRNAGPWVRILKHVSDGELKALYTTATIFAFPSLYEGFGLPVLEAMSCGAPVIASDVSSLPELVGDAAVLVPPEDYVGWAIAIKRLLSNRDLREELSEKGLRRVHEFSWNKTARQTLKVFIDTLCRCKELR